MNNLSQINEALQLVEQILPRVEDVESKLKSARNWSIFDVLGGGTITDLIKHSKLSKAEREMDRVNFLMQQLQRVLCSIQIPNDYRMEIGNFATFADFLFDGAIVDVYMLSKIMGSIRQVSDLKNKLYYLRKTLLKIQ